MGKYIKKIILPIIIVYAGMYLYSAKLANICAISFIIISIATIIIKRKLRKKFVIESIKTIQNEYFTDRCTLKNDNVIVQYEANNLILVKDNPQSKNISRDLKSFKVSHSKKRDINECWLNICEKFDENTIFETLLSYFGSNIHIEITPKRKILAKESNIVQVEKRVVNKFENELFVDLNNIPADKSNIDTYTQQQKKGMPPKDFYLEELELLQKEDITDSEYEIIEEPISEPQNSTDENGVEMFSFTDLLSQSSKKININTASSSEIAILPGINIVMAKRIVNYRQLNGCFKTLEEFIEYSQVKEHFIEKIKSMIEIEIPKNKNLENNSDTNRIID